MHLILEEFQMHTTIVEPKILAKNSGRFRMLTLGKFKIQDSLEQYAGKFRCAGKGSQPD